MKNLFSTNFNISALNIWLLFLRLCTGAFMLTHGLPKLQKLLEGNTNFADPFGIGTATTLALAVFTEFFCSILIMLGLATRFSSILLIFTMLTAAFIAHGPDPFGKKEMSLLYLLLYITLLVLGAGKYSVDQLISKRK